MDKTVEAKVTRKQYLERVAERTGLSLADITNVYNAEIEILKEILQNDERLLLSGFGSFEVIYHKGHPVQFGEKHNFVDKYRVVKFSASALLNKSVRRKGNTVHGVVVKSTDATVSECVAEK